MVTFAELMEPDKLWTVDSGFAYGGLIIRDNKVIKCAPIFKKWFLLRRTGTVKAICRKKGWKLNTK